MKYIPYKTRVISYWRNGYGNNLMVQEMFQVDF